MILFFCASAHDMMGARLRAVGSMGRHDPSSHDVHLKSSRNINRLVINRPKDFRNETLKVPFHSILKIFPNEIPHPP